MAAGPGASRSVGKVSVRVVPDTSKFRRELKAQLEELERQFEVEIPTKLDSARAQAEMAALKKKLDGQSVTIDARINEQGIRNINNFGRPLAALARPLRAFAARMDQAARATNRVTSGIIRMRQGLVQAVVSATSFATGTARMARNMALARDAAGDLRITGFLRSLVTARTYTDALYEGMNKVARGTVHVANGFDRIRRVGLRDVVRQVRVLGTGLTGVGRSATRGLGRLTDFATRGIGKTVAKGFSLLASAGKAAANSLSNISRGGLITIAVLGLLAPVLGLVSGLIAGLPSLMAAGGAAFAAIKLGMDGIKKSAEVLKPAIERMKKTLSSTFEKGLTPVFKQLNTVMPVLERGLKKVAEGLIPLAKGFTEVVTSAQGMRQIETILAETGKFFASLKPAIQDFTSAFLTLAEAGSRDFDLLGGVINRFAATWKEMVNRVASDGTLHSALQGLSQVTDALLDAFTRMFESGLRMMGAIGPSFSGFIRSFVDLFVAMEPTLIAISKLLWDVLGEVLRALVPVFKALSPAIMAIADTIGQLLVGAIRAATPILETLARIVSEVLLIALDAIRPILPPLITFLTQLGTIVGQFLVEAFRVLQPLLVLVSQFFRDLFVALQPILPSLLTLARTIGEALITALTTLMPHIMTLAQIVLPLLIEIAKQVAPFIGELARMFAELLPPILSVITTVAEILAPVFLALLDVVKAVWPSIEGIIKGAMEFIRGIFNIFGGIFTGDWSRVWEGVKGVFRGAWQILKNIVSGAIDGVISFVASIPGKVVGALGDLGSLLWNAGKSLIEGLGRGIKAAVNGVIDGAKWVLGKIRNLFPFSPAKEGPFSGKGYTLYSGRALMLDWGKGIEQGTPAALRAAEEAVEGVNLAASSSWDAQIQAEGYGSLGQVISEALAGWEVILDPNGQARLVNKVNRKNARR